MWVYDGSKWYLFGEFTMAINVKLPESLVQSAKRYGTIEHRSVPKRLNTGLKLAGSPPKTQICPSALSVTS
jgi:hypothetical protein